MPIPTNGPIKFSDIQTIFGGTAPISISEYYKDAAGGYTSNVSDMVVRGQPINIGKFKGKSNIISKTVTLQTGTFQAIGVAGAWLGFNSPAVTLPDDYNNINLKSFDFYFYSTRTSSQYPAMYITIGINNVFGTEVMRQSSAPTGPFNFQLYNLTYPLGTAGSNITCFVSMYSRASLANCYCKIIMRYDVYN